MDRFMNRRTFLRLGGMSLAFTVASPAVARRLQDPRRLIDGLPEVYRGTRRLFLKEIREYHRTYVWLT